MKKVMHISGRLLFSLKVENCAVIMYNGNFIYTSRVVEILEETNGFAHFETMNSVYQVSLTPIPITAKLPEELALCA